MHKLFCFRISVPGFCHMPVRGKQSLAHQEPSTRYARPNCRRVVRKSNLINAVNVAHGIAVPAQHQRRHRLVSFKLRDLLRERTHLLLQIVRLRRQHSRGRVIMKHRDSADQQRNSQYALHYLLPIFTYFARALRRFRFGHGFRTSPVSPALARGESRRRKPGVPMMPCRARLFYGTEGTVREVLKDDQTILSILTGAAFPERSRFQAVILSSWSSCHPERSRFSGEAKDLPLKPAPRVSPNHSTSLLLLDPYPLRHLVVKKASERSRSPGGHLVILAILSS